MTLKAILRRTFRVYVVQLNLGDFSQGYISFFHALKTFYQ